MELGARRRWLEENPLKPKPALSGNPSNLRQESLQSILQDRIPLGEAALVINAPAQQFKSEQFFVDLLAFLGTLAVFFPPRVKVHEELPERFIFRCVVLDEPVVQSYRSL